MRQAPRFVVVLAVAPGATVNASPLHAAYLIAMCAANFVVFVTCARSYADAGVLKPKTARVNASAAPTIVLRGTLRNIDNASRGLGQLFDGGVAAHRDDLEGRTYG